MKPKILVTGGAGYIGSHASLYLYKNGYDIIILDNFMHDQNFNPDWATVIRSDFSDESVLTKIFTENSIYAVMHFAGFIEVGDSVLHPLNFYENNVCKTVKLVSLMLKFEVKKLIFSSSCAVYGNPEIVPITERCARNPISPYGRTKAFVEDILQDAYKAHGLSSVSLRYFNACGAMPEFYLGEQHKPETHIIPILLEAMHEDKVFKIFGDDYDTKDGTCIRDYLHVWDIAQAHYLALKYLELNNSCEFFNLGSGVGFSVKDIIRSFEEIADKSIVTHTLPRRHGDPAVLVADATRSLDLLGWKPACSSLQDILKSAMGFYVLHAEKKSIYDSALSGMPKNIY